MNKINHKYIIAFVFLILVRIDVKSQTLLTERAWADSLYNAMSDDERIGQLFMVMAFSNKDRKETAKIL